MKKYAVYIILILVILVVLKWEWIKSKLPAPVQNILPGGISQTDSPDMSGTPGFNAGLDYKKILKHGVTGPEVETLQSWLNLYAGESLQVDGIFGSKTETALMKHTGLKTITLEKAVKEISDRYNQMNPFLK